MSLVKCPDCEKMVSKRVDKCPFCGCPAKFFLSGETSKNNEEQLVQQKEARPAESTVKREAVATEKVTFLFGKYSVSFPVKGATYAALFGTYLQAADMAYAQMLDLYKKAGTIRRALEILPDKAYEFIFGLIDKGTEFLYSEGIYITQEEFFKKYNRTYTMDYDRFYSITVEKYSEILDMKNEMAAYREAVRASRGRWQGGGFGVKGAVKGAVTASALNMGSDFLHSFGDSSREKKDNEAVRKELRTLYKNSEGQLCHSVKTCMINVYKAMCEELKAINIFDAIIHLQPQKAESIYENTKKYETDKDNIKRNMMKCIALYPGERKYYEVFREDFMTGETDIKDFLEFWHLEYLLSDIISRRDRQDEFDCFMIQKGIEDFDFKNLTADNVVTLWSWLNEYAKDIPDSGKWAKNVSGYLKQFRDNQEEYTKEILIDYLPLNLKYWEFYNACEKNQKWLGIKALNAFSSYVTSDNNERIKKLLEVDGDYIQLYCDTSITEMGSKGLAVTDRYVINLKNRNRIKITDIKTVEVEKIGKYKFELRFSDDTQEIRFYCDEIRESDSSAYYLKNYLKAVFVRYGNNKFLTISSTIQKEHTIIEEQPLDKEGAEQYFGYIRKYQENSGKLVDLELSNSFRRRFKSIWARNSSILEAGNVINKYDYEIPNNSIIQRIGGKIVGQYILVSTNVFTLTDRNMYINGRQYELTTIREIVLFANMHIENNGLIYIVMDEMIEVVPYKRIMDLSYFDEIFYMIDVALEGLQTKNVKVHYDMADLFYCEKCGSIDVKQGLISWKCEKCGNKKFGKICKIMPKNRSISYLRKLANGFFLSADAEKEVFMDEIRHASWIKSTQKEESAVELRG